MKWNEHMIARAISLQTLARKCVVLVDNCNWTGPECDVLAVSTDLRIIDIEVKISRSDLKADAKKDKWWHRYHGGWNLHGPERARTHPLKVWKHYYAMPAEIWKPELLECLPSKASGVLLLTKQGATQHDPDGGMVVVRCERRATPAKDAHRLTPAEVMDIARLANLRMWDAYQQAEQARTEAEDYYHGRRAVLTQFEVNA